MCAPLVIAAIGVAVSAAGAAYSASSQSKAANVAAKNNDAAISAQNQGFWARNADAQRQLQAQGTAQGTAQAAQEAAFDRQREGQNTALDSRDQAVAAQNRAAGDIRAQADAQAQTLLDATNAGALQGARADDVALREEAVAPAALNIQTANPLGTTAGAETKQAFASRMAEAAGNVRTYGQRLAQMSSYTAPLTTVSQAQSGAQAGIMPVAAANQLLQSGQAQRILPSETAYQIAKTQGASAQGMIGAALEGDLGVAKNEFEGNASVANLRQGNQEQIARNNTVRAQQQAAKDAALGQLISTAGNIASYGAGQYGDKINGFFGGGQGVKEPLTGMNYGGGSRR